MVFVELCLNEARHGNKPGSHCNKVGYENLINNMKEHEKLWAIRKLKTTGKVWRDIGGCLTV